MAIIKASQEKAEAKMYTAINGVQQRMEITITNQPGRDMN
jgi:hypothetical protein